MSQQAAVYQQLRSHLAYLRLAAAAEALAQELEHATRQGLGHTAFLERLLSLEVRATQERRLASLLRFASFPAHWRLEDFDFNPQRGQPSGPWQTRRERRFGEPERSKTRTRGH